MPGPQAVRDLAGDPNFAALAPGDRDQVYNTISAKDSAYQALAPDVQAEVRTHILGGGPASSPLPAQPGAVSRFGSDLFGGINPVEMIRGLAHLVAHPIDTYKADLAERHQIGQEATKESQAGDLLGGATGTLKRIESWVPGMGPAMHRIGQKMESGDVAGGMGAALAIALNLAAPWLLKELPSRIPIPGGQAAGERLYRWSLKPPPSTPAETVAQAVRSGIAHDEPVSTVGLQKVADVMDTLEARRSQIVQSTGPQRNVSPATAVGYSRDLETRFGQQVNPETDVAAIQGSREEFLNKLRSQPGGAVRNMMAEEADNMIKQTNAKLRKSYGEMSTAVKENQKQLVRGVRDELNDQFPELGNVKTEEAGQLALDPLLELQVARQANRMFPSVGTAMIAGVGKAVTGSGGAAGLAGFLKGVIDTPAITSRIAILLSKGANIKYPVALARVQGYVNALGQTVDAASSEAGDSQIGR